MKNLLYIAILLISASVMGQDIPFHKKSFPNERAALKNAQKAIKKGDISYHTSRYRHGKALSFYLQAQAFNPENAELNFKIGHCYLNSNEKFKALYHLLKAEELGSNLPPTIDLYLGQAQQLELEWDKAEAAYKKYKTGLTDKQPDQLKKVEKHLKECEYGRQYTSNPVKVKIDNLGASVNGKFPEYGPVISADESVIIFTSRRDNTTGGKIDQLWNIWFEDIYISEKEGDNWKDAKNIGTPVNTSGHDAVIGLSADGQKLFLYKDDFGDGNIYMCKLQGSKWSEPERLNSTINSKYHESSVSFSFDERTLYFVSKNPENNMGDRDIFISNLEAEDVWGEPTNIGSTINTPYGEEGVFMHPDGKTLYFSSQGHSSMGGYDIFKSVFDQEKGEWSEPENLGYPINTAGDDVFFVMSASGKHGYYSSIQADGHGEKDLYRITFLEEKKQEPQLTLLKGVIADASTNQPLQASIEIIDNEKNEVVATFTSNSETGKFLISLPSGKNYNITASTDGYLFHSENINIPRSEGYQEIEKDIALHPIKVGEKIVLNNIFFDYDKASLRDESQAELGNLEKLLKSNAAMKVEISGHTDNKGSDAYNNKLSENRAKAVVQFLAGKGIPASRMIYKGYGESKPVANNETDEGRQMNRRTEFKVISN